MTDDEDRFGGEDDPKGLPGRHGLFEWDDDLVLPSGLWLRGGRGDDLVLGGLGADLIWGQAGDDLLFGEAGNDVLIGSAGADTLFGGGGNDLLLGGGVDDDEDDEDEDDDDGPRRGLPDDVLDGGAGNDLVRAGGGDDRGIYTWQENLAATDLYDDGHGFDTLEINLTHGEARLRGIEAELQAYRDYLDTHADAHSGGGSDGGSDGDEDDGPPDPGFTFTSFDLTVRNWEELEVNLVNTGPAAMPDAAETDQNTPVTVDVMANDSDPDHLDELTLDDVTVTSGLGAAWIAGGEVVYDPTPYHYLAEGETAPVVLTYGISDLAGEGVSATVAVTVHGLNDAPTAYADSEDTDEDTALVIPAGRLLLNDTDPDLSDTLTIVSVGAALNGSVSLESSGDVRFTPTPDFGGIAQFDYTVSDGHGGFDTAPVTVAVRPVADPPTLDVSDASQYVNGVIPLSITAALADTDGSETLSVVIAGLPPGSVLSAGSENPDDGTWTLDAADLPGLTLAPPAGSPGRLDLTVTATAREILNGDTASAAAPMTVIVNRPPVAVDDAFGLESVPVRLDFNGSVNLADYQGYAFDAFYKISGYGDGDQTSVYTYSLRNSVDGMDGALRRADGGDFTLGGFRARSYNVSHVASIFGYKDGAVVASDTLSLSPIYGDFFDFGNDWSGIDEVRFDMPSTTYRYIFLDNVDLSHQTGPDEDTAIDINVLANDWDADPTDVLSVAAAGPLSAMGAAIAVNTDGTVRYDPSAAPDLQALAAGAIETDSFEYTVTDDRGATDTATVTVTVIGRNDAPVANADDLGPEPVTDEDTAAIIDTARLLTNDRDPDKGDSVAVGDVQFYSVLGARVGVLPDGTVYYDPTRSKPLQALLPGETATDTITYRAFDGSAYSDWAEATVVVSGVIDPLFTGYDDTVDFDTVLAGTYVAGTQYFASSGHDQVFLPSDVTQANEAGFVPDTPFYGSDGYDTIVGRGLDDVVYGGSQNDEIRGGAGNDRLYGERGNDELFGDDDMAGGRDDDTYVVDSPGDVVTEVFYGGAADTVQAHVDYTLGANLENLELHGAATVGRGNTLDNTIRGKDAEKQYELHGGDGADTLYGEGLDDTLDGGPGADAMYGLDGDDTYVVDDLNDQVFEDPGADAGMDTVEAHASHTLGANVEILRLFGAATTGRGNDDANWLYGKTSQFSILEGGGGNDELYGGDAGNQLDGGDDDLLVGGGGDDYMSGGDGNDTYIVDSSDDRVYEAYRGGQDRVEAHADFSIATSGYVETLALFGVATTGEGSNYDNTIYGNADLANTLNGFSGNDTLYGGAGNDELTGGFGYDTLYGRGGDDVLRGGTLHTMETRIDTMFGGAGDDTYWVDYIGDKVNEDPGEGTDTVNSSVDYTLGPDVENLELFSDAAVGIGNDLNNVIWASNFQNNSLEGRGGDDTLHGGNRSDTLEGCDGADTLYGGGSADILDGGAGDDVMEGGDGSDTYIVDSALDTVFEDLANGGQDRVEAHADYSLAGSGYVETLSLFGTASRGEGNEHRNTINGNVALSNTLLGGAGNDTLKGGNMAGILDGGTASFSIALSGYVENLTLSGAASWGQGNDRNNIIHGSAGEKNDLEGLGGNDTLVGGDLADELDGGTGWDDMYGGDGNDIYWVDGTFDDVFEDEGEGTDTVKSSVSYVLGDHVENLKLFGSATSGTGNELNNEITGMWSARYTLSGLGGDDTLYGSDDWDTLDVGTGDDVMEGGDGRDTYIVDSALDVVREDLADGSTDTVEAHVGYSIAGSGYVENLTLLGTAGWGEGNDLRNIITGNLVYANELYGLGGIDVLKGGFEADILDGGDGDDVMTGGGGNDYYYVDSTNDRVNETSSTGGTDSVEAYADFAIAGYVENLALFGAAVEGRGNNIGNTIIGNALLANKLYGLGGSDVLEGGAENDILDGGPARTR